MRKILRRAGAFLLTVLVVFSLINFSPITAKAATGDTLTIYCWNDEFLEYVIKYMPGYTEGRDKYHGMLDGVPVEWIETPSYDSEYRNKLSKDLLNDTDIDIFLTQAGYSQLYCRPGVAKSLDSLGITSAELSKQFAYTQQYSTYNGKVYGSEWYCSPGIMIYNREIAREVLGTDDPEQVQAMVSNWDKFNSVADQMSNAGYLVTASSDFLFRPYAATNTSSWVVNGSLNVDSKYSDWANESRSLYQKGQTRACDLWDNSFTDFYSNISFCVFGPIWFWDYCMAYDVSPYYYDQYGESIADHGGWAVCEGPQAFDWGGTILSVAEKSDNVSDATKLIRAMTFNDTVATNIVSTEGAFTYFINNKSAINYCVNNASYNNCILGNQNPFSILQTVAEHINISDTSGYDLEMTDMFTVEMRDYINGTISYETALANFQSKVSEKYPTFDPQQLSTPVLTVKNTDEGVLIEWNKVSGAEKYRVFRKTGSGSWTTLVTQTTTSYKDKSAKDSVTYTYTVRCMDASETKYTSDFDRTGKTIKCQRKLDTPVLTVKNTDSGVLVEWNKVSEAEKYRVFRRTGSGSWTILATQTGISYKDTSAKDGETYTYTVRCMDAAETKYTSDFDKVGKTIKCQRKLDTPELTVKKVDGGVLVEWNEVAGAENYRIFRRTGSGSWTILATQTGISYKDTSAKNGETYTYTVRCMDGAATKYTSDFDKVGKTIKYQSELATPEFTLKNTDAGVLVEWGTVEGAENYRVFRRIGSGSWTVLTTQTATSYTDTSVNEGTTYIYTVRCMDSTGTKYTSGFNKNDISIQYQKSAQPQTDLPTPELNVNILDNGVQISWNAIEGAAQYRVFRRVNGGGWQIVATLAGTECFDTTVEGGNSYTYTVRCVSEDGSKYTSGFDKQGKTVVIPLSAALVTE